MGASLIGRECDRELFYSFNWATKPRFNGQKLRLFNRGHLEEGRFIALMLMIGCEVFQQDQNGKQYRISDVGGHFGGSGDGVVIGIPDLAPGTPALSEWKTHNDKSFKKLESEGVRSAKFEHWVQMQTYMDKMGLPVAIYGAVNKNDDNIHMEIIHMDRAAGPFFIERARRVIPLRTPPAKIAASVGAFQCKFCDHKPVCKMGANPERNCRTCSYSRPIVDEDGAQWVCDAHDSQTIPKPLQLTGCDNYEKNSNF